MTTGCRECGGTGRVDCPAGCDNGVCQCTFCKAEHECGKCGGEGYVPCPTCSKTEETSP